MLVNAPNTLYLTFLVQESQDSASSEKVEGIREDILGEEKEAVADTYRQIYGRIARWER
jgi:hypothetical protein